MVGLLLAGGCTTKQYAQQADKDSYKVLAQKQTAALATSQPFSIDYRPFLPGAGENRPLFHGKPIPMGEEPQRVLSLAECQEIAFTNSRSFQTRKETLYISALALANARHQWSLLGGSLNSDVSRTTVNGAGSTNSATGNPGLSFAQRFANGGRGTLGLGLSLASDLLSQQSTTLGSLISANFTQPLLRGAWFGFAYESLYRQERNLAFAVLDYERFTQTFSVTVATRYYQVLQQLDELENEKANIVRLQKTLALTHTLVQGGQRSRLEEYQAEQDLLSARVRFTSNTQGYQDSLDNFKLLLGLPIQANIALDPKELEALNKRGPVAAPFDEEKAVDVAMHTRPDVLTQQASVRDARRDVEIAADQFLPGVDLTTGISAPGTPPRDALAIQFDQHTRAAGVKLDYNLDQTDDRDAYRRAQIAQAQAERNYAEFLDNVRLQVRQTYRQLVQARESYDLQLRSVQVAQRRSKLAGEEQKAGQASARDVLDAEEGLRTAQNGLTAALVSYETTRINFLATLGMLDVKENGEFHERTEPFRFDRLEEQYHQADLGSY